MSTPRKTNPQKRGRKPTWRDGYLEQAKKLAALGATEVEMANFFGVSPKTLTRWKVSRPEFWLALKAAKDVADARVERRLYERAIGYKTNAVKIMNIRGRVVSVPYVINVVPFTAPMDDNFGLCPICRRTDHCLSVGLDHYYLCHRHKVKWHIGSNLFAVWRGFDSKEDWERYSKRNWYLLSTYREVEPAFHMKRR